MSNLVKTQTMTTTVPLFEKITEENVKRSQELLKTEIGENQIQNLQEQIGLETFDTLFNGQVWLHVKWHYNCYFVYAEYYFEAWTTASSDPNSARVSVETLELRWRHGNTRGHEVANNVSMVAKSDRTYNLGCDTDLCSKGYVQHLGGNAVAMNPDNCLP